MSTRNDFLWQMRFCIPFWVIQIFWIVLEIGLTAWALVVIQTDSDELESDFEQVGDGDLYGDWQRTLTIAFAVSMVFYVIMFIMTVGEMALYCINKLNPIIYLISNVLKAAFWLVVLILDIANNSNGILAAKSVILAAIVFVCFLVPMIYGAVIYHRYRHSGRAIGGVRRTYTQLERGGLDADARDTAHLNPLNDPAETYSNYSGPYSRTHSRNASATEMGDIPAPAQPRYGDGGLPAVAVTQPDSRTGLRGGLAQEYYQPPAPERTGGYEEYRGQPPAASMQGKGQVHELGFVS